MVQIYSRKTTDGVRFPAEDSNARWILGSRRHLFYTGNSELSLGADCEETMDVRRRIGNFEYAGEINIEDLQPHAVGQPPKWRRAVENSLWMSAASFMLYYGDSHSNFFSVLFSNPRIVRRPFYVGLLCVAINTLIFFYLAVWLRHIRKRTEPWDYIAPGAIPTATILGVAAFVMFVFALWPVWGFLTLPLLVTLFMAFVIISPYLPPYTKTNKDSYRED